MKFKIYFALLFLSSGVVLAQENDSIIAVFEISDQNGLMIEGVQLQATQGDATLETLSNKDGTALLIIERFGELKTTFLHPWFSKRTTIEEIPENTSLDTLYFKVTLTSIKSLNLTEVQVTAPGVPEVVYSSKKKSVQDFEILDENNIILLAYPKRLKKGSQLLLYDPIGSVRDSIEIEEEAVELIRDYEGHLYLIHTTGCKRILVNDNKIETLDISIFYLRRYVLPIVGTTENKMIFSTYDELYPAFDYYQYNVEDSVYKKFASVVDEEMMEMFRAESRYSFNAKFEPINVRQKLEAKNYELATGVDAEIYYGRKYFTGSIYYEPLFAPMFQVNDNFYLFDYHCDSLKKYNSDGELVSEISITHDHNERRTGWQKSLLQDPISHTVYALYERGGFYYLNSIDLITGEIADPVKLNNRYAENIQVYDGYIYYVYRPFESYQKKYFWREKIPNR